MSVVELARPGIRTLEPYEAAAQVEDTVRLNANEAPWTSDVDRFRRPLNRYPEVRPARLRRVLAERFGCADDQLLVTRGTSEAIDLLIRVFCTPGSDNLVTVSPTFSMYAHYAVIQDAELRSVQATRERNFDVSADELLAVCDDASKLLFVCSPNNPTGNLVPESTLLRLLDARRDRSVVVVDEAYIEFSNAKSAVGLISEYDNLVVLRTLSKALAFAGARCGALIGSAGVTRMLDAVQAPYAMATPVVECVEDALTDALLDQAREQVGQTIDERQRLTRALTDLGIVERIWPSEANFFLAEMPGAASVVDECARQGVLLRRFGGELADCVRISIGSADENDRLIDVLHAMDGRLQ